MLTLIFSYKCYPYFWVHYWKNNFLNNNVHYTSGLKVKSFFTVYYPAPCGSSHLGGSHGRMKIYSFHCYTTDPQFSNSWKIFLKEIHVTTPSYAWYIGKCSTFYPISNRVFWFLFFFTNTVYRYTILQDSTPRSQSKIYLENMNLQTLFTSQHSLNIWHSFYQHYCVWKPNCITVFISIKINSKRVVAVGAGSTNYHPPSI